MSFWDFQFFPRGGVESRVTRLFFVKYAQNVAQSIFLSKLVHDFCCGKSGLKNSATFCHFQKTSKSINNDPRGKNWPNLVTLLKGVWQ
jgi:hypothetical protein